MAGPQPGKSRLELLPNELLMITFEALASDNLDIKDFKAYSAYKDSLYSLCLVSKTMAVISRPALYRDVRLYSYVAVVRLCATLQLVPALASNIKSMLLCPPDDSVDEEICTIDLSPLRRIQDRPYAFWTKGRSKAKVQMPQKSRAELVYILFAKTLSTIPALESLYFKFPELHPITSSCLEGLPADPQFMLQLNLQAVLFQDFCRGNFLPNVSELHTVGFLGTNPVYDAGGIYQRLLRCPKLHKVLIASYRSGSEESPHLGYWNLLATCSKDSESSSTYWFFVCVLFSTLALTSPVSSTTTVPAKISTSVKRMEIRNLVVYGQQIVDLTTAFPSLESLSIDHCHVYHGSSLLTLADNYPLFQSLGGLENFHTLELDAPRKRFATDITTESGPSTIVTLSALSSLRILLVPVDFFIGFTDNEQPHFHRENVVLPGSLRHLTLLLNFYSRGRLLPWNSKQTDSFELMVEPFLGEVGPALLIEFSHLEQVDLCYNMEDYRQHKLRTLAARLTNR